MNERSFRKPARPLTAKRPPRRRPRDARAAILGAAYRLFLHQGYHGTSMRQIAGRARLTPAAIYNHFSGKEAIFLALLAERIPQRAIIRALANTEGQTVEDLVHHAFARMNEAMADQYDNMRLLFIELLEFQGRHARAVADEFLPQALGFIGRLQAARGNLRSLEPLIVARAFLGLFMSYVITEAFFPKIPGLESRMTDLQELGEILLHGVLSSPDTDEPGPPAGGASPRQSRR